MKATIFYHLLAPFGGGLGVVWGGLRWFFCGSGGSPEFVKIPFRARLGSVAACRYTLPKRNLYWAAATIVTGTLTVIRAEPVKEEDREKHTVKHHYEPCDSTIDGTSEGRETVESDHM